MDMTDPGPVFFQNPESGYLGTRIDTQGAAGLPTTHPLAQGLHDLIRDVEIGIDILDIVIILQGLHHT